MKTYQPIRRLCSKCRLDKKVFYFWLSNDMDRAAWLCWECNFEGQPEDSLPWRPANISFEFWE